MITPKDTLKRNVVFLKNQNIHVGCGYIICVEKTNYCITAGHVVFGKNFDREKILDIYDSLGRKILSSELLTDKIFATTFDLAIIKINDTLDFVEPIAFCSAIINPTLTSFSYVKASCLDEPFFIEEIKYNDKLDGNKLNVTIPSQYLHDFTTDKHAADMLGGISGSPVILNIPGEQLIFHGVITKVINNGVGGIIEIRTLESLQDIINSITFTPQSKLDENCNIFRYQSQLTESENFDKWVNKWKQEPGNEEYYNNLETKLKTIFGDGYKDKIPKELERIMIGDAYIKNVIERDSVLYESYQDIIKTAERDHMETYVSNKRDAHMYYQKISDNHFETVKDDLDDFGLRKSDLKKIAQHDVSTWLAVCHLRFIEK